MATTSTKHRNGVFACLHRGIGRFELSRVVDQSVGLRRDTMARYPRFLHIELDQQLSVSSSSMSPKFNTTLLPGRLIQSVLLPLSSLTAVHLIFAICCQSSQISTQTNHTSGKCSMTLGRFESQHLPENRNCEKNAMTIGTTFR